MDTVHRLFVANLLTMKVSIWAFSKQKGKKMKNTKYSFHIIISVSKGDFGRTSIERQKKNSLFVYLEIYHRLPVEQNLKKNRFYVEYS